jgi:hypothetical protein
VLKFFFLLASVWEKEKEEKKVRAITKTRFFIIVQFATIYGKF